MPGRRPRLAARGVALADLLHFIFFAHFFDFFKCWNAILTEIAFGSGMGQEKREPRLGWLIGVWSGWARHYLGNEWSKGSDDWCLNGGSWGRWERWWKLFFDWRLGSKVDGAGFRQQGTVKRHLDIEREFDFLHHLLWEFGKKKKRNRVGNRGRKVFAKHRIRNLSRNVVIVSKLDWL